MIFMIDLIFMMIFVIEKNRVDFKLPKIKKNVNLVILIWHAWIIGKNFSN